MTCMVVRKVETEGEHEEKKRLLKVGSAALGGMLLLAWLWVGPDEDSLAVQTPEPKATAASAPMGRQEVQGLSKAAETRELHDPFTLAHETASEAKLQAESASPKQDELKAPPPPPPEKAEVPATTPKPDNRAAAANAMPVLQGIAEGAGGRLAMLSMEGQSVTLGEGESRAGWQVQKIEKDKVQVSGPDGTVWLGLKMY